MPILFRFAIVLLLTVGAGAESFNYTFTTRNQTLTGVMYGRLVSPGVYELGGITGAFVPGQDPPLNEIAYIENVGGVNHADNLLFTSEPYLSPFGINFVRSNGITSVLAHDEAGYFLLSYFSNRILRTPGELEVSSTIPEPPSLLLMASGIALLGTQVKRRRFGRA